MMHTSLQQLRKEIEASLKAKKTLDDLELFDYIVACIEADELITKSRIIKKLRDEGYSISQSRVFVLFAKVHACIQQIELEAVIKQRSGAEQAKLKQAEQEKLELQQKLAALEKQLKAATKK
jgi:type I restriction-modification system DNA methylase subunit